jgi:hypothetical protein
MSGEEVIRFGQAASLTMTRSEAFEQSLGVFVMVLTGAFQFFSPSVYFQGDRYGRKS